MKGRRSSRSVRLVRVALWGLAAAHVLEAIWLRRRRDPFRVLDAPDQDKAISEAVDVVTLGAAHVDDETLAAAAREMETTGLEMIDLVPGDLPTERALRLLRRVDLPQLGSNPLYAPGGAHEAIALSGSLAKRMGIDAGDEDRTVERDQLLRTTVSAQRHAPLLAGLRLAPGAQAGPMTPADRWREWEGLTAAATPHVALAPPLAGLETAHLAALTAGLLVAPVAGLAALVTWSSQPALVFGSGHGSASAPAWKPPDLWPASLLRLPLGWLSNIRTLVAGSRKARDEAAERAGAPPPAVPPADELFDPRRATCPWCSSGSLVERLSTTDLFQLKPGRFHLDECRDCGHVFQNPMLSPAGLDYYYQDFYDGLGEAGWVGASFIPPPTRCHHDNRFTTVGRFRTPRAWLDVGTGYGHFCLAARQQWPEATFDGLDLGEGIEGAQRRGWVDTGHRGQFPELAASLPRYDVISMHHYLEHTRDPRQEIAAAAKVLEPGGLLEIEVPDPEFGWARHLGRYWMSWFQPQHLHFITHDNMTRALQDEGFEVVASERGTVSPGLDLTMATLLGIQAVAGNPHFPWLPAPSLTGQAKRIAVIAAAVPVLIVARLVDDIKDPRLGPDDIGGAYRIVARKPGDEGRPGS